MGYHKKQKTKQLLCLLFFKYKIRGEIRKTECADLVRKWRENMWKIQRNLIRVYLITVEKNNHDFYALSSFLFCHLFFFSLQLFSSSDFLIFVEILTFFSSSQPVYLAQYFFLACWFYYRRHSNFIYGFSCLSFGSFVVVFAIICTLILQRVYFLLLFFLNHTLFLSSLFWDVELLMFSSFSI